jgi:hypothetical protein
MGSGGIGPPGAGSLPQGAALPGRLAPFLAGGSGAGQRLSLPRPGPGFSGLQGEPRATA